MDDLVGATADGCVYCGRCECGDAEDRRKAMANEIHRLRRELHGATFFAAIMCARNGGVIEVRPDEFLDVPPSVVLHRFDELDGRVLYSIVNRAELADEGKGE